MKDDSNDGEKGMSKSKESELPSTGKIQRDRASKLFETLSKESDRGLVLVSAAYLDETLEDLLRSVFSIRRTKSKSLINPLFDGYGPLGTFSAKTRIAHSLDLISKWMYSDIEIVRRMRNVFAHGIDSVSFDDPEISKLTERLKGADHAVRQKYKGADHGVKSTIKNKEKVKRKTSKKGEEKSKKAIMERTRLTMSVSYIGGILAAELITLSIDDVPPEIKLNVVNDISDDKHY